MKLRFLLPALLALVLMVAACSPPPPLRDDTLLNDTSIITGEPCAAPCWRGITPGTTSWADALVILEDDAELGEPNVQESEENDAIAADFAGETETTCCQVVSEDGETVSIVFLRTAPIVTVGEVIERYGNPTYVVGQPYSDEEAIMSLIFPDVPMILYALVAGTTGSLRADSEIIGTLYTTSRNVELLVETSNLHDWDGYDTYESYEQGEFEVTPLPTLTPTAESGE